MYWCGYFGIENLALNASQKAALLDALIQLGDNDSPLPNYRNHRRFRMDNEAAIFEARFRTDNISIDAVKGFLGAIFNVDPGTIDHEVTTPVGNTVIVFSRNGTDYLRMAFFGSLGCTWQQSRQNTIAYLKSNMAEWESVQ